MLLAPHFLTLLAHNIFLASHFSIYWNYRHYHLFLALLLFLAPHPLTLLAPPSIIGIPIPNPLILLAPPGRVASWRIWSTGGEMSVNSYLYLYLDQVVPLSFSYRLSFSYKPVNFLITPCSVLSIAIMLILISSSSKENILIRNIISYHQYPESWSWWWSWRWRCSEQLLSTRELTTSVKEEPRTVWPPATLGPGWSSSWGGTSFSMMNDDTTENFEKVWPWATYIVYDKTDTNKKRMNILSFAGWTVASLSQRVQAVGRQQWPGFLWQLSFSLLSSFCFDLIVSMFLWYQWYQ